MSYTIDDHFDTCIREQLEAGRENSVSEVVREGLRLVEKHEVKLKALRNHVSGAIEQDGSYSDEDIAQTLTSTTLLMYKLRYLAQAKDDLLAIKRYIVRESGSQSVTLPYHLT